MQEEVCGSRWVGYIGWWNPCTFLVEESSYVLSMVVLSLVHQNDDLAVKSSKMVNKELHRLVSLKTFSKFDKKFSNLKLPWIGDLYTTST